MRVRGGPLDGAEVDWTSDTVRVPVGPDFACDEYRRERPPLIQGDDYYRYVGRAGIEPAT